MKKKRTADKTKIPDAIRQLLGPPPILSTEDQHLYYATIETLAKDVNPDDIVTWFLIKDLGDYRTEIARYRRFKVSWLKKKYQQEISDVIETLHSGQPERLTVITQIKDGRIAQLREQYRDDPLELELGEKEILERYEQDIDLSEHLLEIAVDVFVIGLPMNAISRRHLHQDQHRNKSTKPWQRPNRTSSLPCAN